MSNPFLRMLRSPDPTIPPIIVAPMVNQSELAFRLLCRQESHPRLCFTPMMHAKLFSESPSYRERAFETCKDDHPLIAQFCGNDPQILLRAAQHVEAWVEGVDLNLGCPQGIARRGRYGAFLLENSELLEAIVSCLARNLRVPVSCKIRLVPGQVSNTVELCKRLEKAGAMMITVHGRYREQNKHLVGEANWEAIRLVKNAVSIPVVANGGIGGLKDVMRCLEMTGVDAVMTCEAILENPKLFGKEGDKADPFQVALEYLDLARIYTNLQPKCAKPHLFKMLFGTLPQHKDFFARLGQSKDLDELTAVVKELRDMHRTHPLLCSNPLCGTYADGPWYNRYRRDDDDEGGSKRLRPGQQFSDHGDDGEY